ncbi:MAG: hypothetical protein V3V14_10945 [Saprospiraceae bacterium]
MKHLLLAFISILLLISCSSETENFNVEYGYEYYPLTVGNEWTYQVDSTFLISGGSTKFESSSYLKEEVVGLLSEDGDEKKYKLARSFSNSPDGPWNLINNWTVSISERRATKTENNIRFIKMIFPIENNLSWNGNLFFDSEREVQVGPDKYELYKDWKHAMVLADDKTVLDISYNKIVNITHIDQDDNFVLKKLSTESYARNIGLIESHSECFASLNGKDNAAPWLSNADKGFIITQKLVAYSIQ